MEKQQQMSFILCCEVPAGKWTSRAQEGGHTLETMNTRIKVRFTGYAPNTALLA